MSILGAAIARAVRRGARPVASQSMHVAPPAGGLNTVDSPIPDSDATVMWNLIGGEYGLRVRLGSKEWSTGLGGPVRSIMPFNASVAASNKVFATTEAGIWDVTSTGSSYTVDTAFGVGGATAGYGSSCHMVTAAGHFLLYADETNGCFIYPEGGPWAAASFTGVSAANIVHVQAHKNRLWLTERGSGKVWYLATNAISGTATSFNVGARFKSGGEVKGCWSWTYDGGGGIDDSLVVVSSGGDVLVYQGLDPSVAGQWNLRGVWQVGALPEGRNIASDLGGDLLLMTRHGLLPMSKLVLGSVQGDASQYATRKIQNFWNKAMLTRASAYGWAMVQSPEDASLIVIAPTADTTESEQYVLSLATQGWSRYRGLSMGNCAAQYAGKVWYGTVDGKIRILDGYTDGRTVADPSTTKPIGYAFVTGFSTLGTPVQKRLHLIRPTWISDTSAPTYNVAARFRWDMTEADAPAGATAAAANAWDVGLWDTAVWGGDYAPTQEIRGLAGCGPEVAIAITGTSQSRTILTGFDILFDQGAFL